MSQSFWLLVGVNGREIQCQVIQGGIVSDHKGLNLPGVNISAPALTAKDVKDLTGLVGVLNDNQSGPNGLQNLITELPPTVAGLIRTASYGSWFNFYLCDVSGYITLPTGQKTPLNTQSTDARCN